MNWDLAITDIGGVGLTAEGAARDGRGGARAGGTIVRLPGAQGGVTLSPVKPADDSRTKTEIDASAERDREGCFGESDRQPIGDEEFTRLVDAHYEALYRFAFSLAHSEADARDLVQDTFARLARKGNQLKSRGKAKSWLFTTLYRAYIDSHRHHTRHPHVEMEAAELELPVTAPVAGEHLDAEMVQEALQQVDEVFRVPLILFYLDQHSYLEIAEILDVPPGTVMSRISRGRAALRRIFEEKEPASAEMATDVRPRGVVLKGSVV